MYNIYIVCNAYCIRMHIMHPFSFRIFFCFVQLSDDADNKYHLPRYPFGCKLEMSDEV